MLGVILLYVFVYVVAVQGAAHGIDVKCERDNSRLSPPDVSKDFSPSRLSKLTATLVGHNEINISWAVNVDASLEYLTGTRIRTTDSIFLCEYIPPLAKANLPELTEVWFHHKVHTFPGHAHIQAAHIPLPQLGSGPAYESVDVMVPPAVTSARSDPPETTPPPPAQSSVTATTDLYRSSHGEVSTSVALAIIGGLLGMMALTCCFLIYKGCWRSMGFTKLASRAPVSVLLVYPPENPTFQRAVVALAEFLQWHAGCSVAIDIWQQRSIAELGPMRWLAERAKSAERVIVVCPQPSQCAPNHISRFPIPASAYDLYPLVLNMVAGHSRSSSELARFCSVQLGEHRGEPPAQLAVCRRFCLTKDLPKLCKSLHAPKTCGVKALSGPERAFSVKLTEAVGQLAQAQPSSVTMAPAALDTVVTFPTSTNLRAETGAAETGAAETGAA